MAPLVDIISCYEVNYHFYADDCQLWVPVDINDESDIQIKIQLLQNCFSTIAAWMSNHQLKINPEKTEFIIFNSKYRKDSTPSVTINLSGATIHPSSVIRDLGIQMDTNLTFHQQISSVCKAGYFHLRNIKSISRHISRQHQENLIHAFISSKIDFCNTIYFGLPKFEVNRLQKLQNSAARLLTSTAKHAHITPVLKQLHWLPVEQRVIFKILIQTHKCIYTSCPSYLSNILPTRTSTRMTRYSIAPSLAITHRSCVTLGGRSFTSAASSLWNNLPVNLRSLAQLNQFKCQLKTYMFLSHFTQ